MGRDINWYILPTQLEHDTSKLLCFNLEYEPELHEKDEEIYKRILEISPSSQHQPHNKNAWKQHCEHQTLIKKTICTYRNDDQYRDIWCPLCKLYLDGIYNSSLLIASMHIGHCYSDPIWRSDWNIKETYIGSSITPFIHRFSYDHLYREINSENVENCYTQLLELGEPIRSSDINARDESFKVLEFLRTWMDKENVIVIVHDEL